MVSINSFQKEDIGEMWKLVQSYPNFYSDNLKLDTEKNFAYYLSKEVDDAIVIRNGDEMIGFVYLTSLSRRFAEGTVLTKRHRFFPTETIKILKQILVHYFLKYNLKYLYLRMDATNRGALLLAKKMGFTNVFFLPKYIETNGIPVDCIFAGILRESAIGGLCEDIQ